MLEELPKLENMTITTLTESKLVLTEKNGSTVEFAAVKNNSQSGKRKITAGAVLPSSAAPVIVVSLNKRALFYHLN